MNPDARKKQMLPMWEAECCYRDLFLAQPQVYFYDQNWQFFEDWDSFSYLYRQPRGCSYAAKGKGYE